MHNFNKICERLTKLESLRLEPVDPEKLNDALRMDENRPVESLEESFDEFVKESAFIDEELYTPSSDVYQTSYGTYQVQSPETIDLIRSLPIELRQSLSTLRQKKKPNEIVVYSKDKGEVIIVSKDDMEEYLASGYNLIYEDTAIANMSGVDEPYADTSGAFNKVSGKNTPLFKKNKKELKRFKGRIFDVSPAMFERMSKGRAKYESWNSYIQEEGDESVVNDIRRFSLRNSRSPVVIQNTETGERAILRRRHSDNRLRYNRNRLMKTHHEQTIGKNFRRKRAY
tara:strand:+ start:541 stop:1392 length:852 start_codon:yes stop_codon:yes gene_type:complete